MRRVAWLTSVANYSAVARDDQKRASAAIGGNQRRWRNRGGVRAKCGHENMALVAALARSGLAGGGGAAAWRCFAGAISSAEAAARHALPAAATKNDKTKVTIKQPRRLTRRAVTSQTSAGGVVKPV